MIPPHAFKPDTTDLIDRDWVVSALTQSRDRLEAGTPLFKEIDIALRACSRQVTKGGYLDMTEEGVKMIEDLTSAPLLRLTITEKYWNLS